MKLLIRTLLHFSLCMFAIALFLPALGAPKSSRPNIIVFLVDDMGLMDTSVPFLTDADGNLQRHPLNDFYRTPGMQRLAERGIRFSQFYAMSVCSPSRTSLMTGQNAARHRTTNWINPTNNNRGEQGPPDWNWTGLRPESVNIASLLQVNGYHTIHIGKAHFGPRNHPGENPQNLGFDLNIGGSSIGHPGSYYGHKAYGKNLPKRASHAVPGFDKYHGTETFLSEAITLEAKTAIKNSVERQRPFFLHLAHYAVHTPFESDPRFAKNYTESGKSLQAQAFASLIEGMDKSLNDLIDHLEQLGVAENTLILFLGDNGSDAPLGHEHAHTSSAPLRGKKGTHYEGGMRVPFIAAWAKPDSSNPHQQKLPIQPGSVQNQPANITDLFPTLLKLVDLPLPQNHIVDGRPLQKLFNSQPDSEHPQQFLMHFPHKHRSSYFTTWRDGDWKVVYHYLPEVKNHDSASHYQLFHLKDDPYETNDLASSRPEELKRMMQGLVSQLEAHQALYPVDPQHQPIRPVVP